jgi:hypothetical protein
MSAEHYFFPPARAYPLNHCLFLLKSADREAAMEELWLDPEARGALRKFEYF